MITQQTAVDLATVFRHVADCKTTPHLTALMAMDYDVIGNFSGNQGGKTWDFAYMYFLRTMGIHPINRLNYLARKIRCVSPSLPIAGGNDEQDNTQYLELKKMIPPELIEKDITARSQLLVVRRPDGSKTIFDFKSHSQELQVFGRIQLSSCWHDEETPQDKRDECKMRLLAEGGDELFSLTPTNALTYTYNEIWLRAEEIYRTPIIQKKFNLPERSFQNKGSGIGCVQMASDDNPTLNKETIDFLFSHITDPDELAMRRYGIFKQMTGRIHKTYDPGSCYIDFNKIFDNGIPHNWMFAIGIDYHESRIPWSIGWVACSPENEWFLFQEAHPAIDGSNAYNTYEIAKLILRKSGDYRYSVSLIDPLAAHKQPNTGTSPKDDLNRHIATIRRDEGIGNDMYFEGWDTKGKHGRNEISMRFKNSARCGKPFNNIVKENGKITRLPTLWISHDCPQFNKSILTWCYGEHVSSNVKAVNDRKQVPQQKNSHDNMVLEALGKDVRLVNSSFLINNPPRQAMGRNRSITGR
jgi:hypothetical protein